jgi:hypothetical protein
MADLVDILGINRPNLHKSLEGPAYLNMLMDLGNSKHLDDIRHIIQIDNAYTYFSGDWDAEKNKKKLSDEELLRIYDNMEKHFKFKYNIPNCFFIDSNGRKRKTKVGRTYKVVKGKLKIVPLKKVKK